MNWDRHLAGTYGCVLLRARQVYRPLAKLGSEGGLFPRRPG